MKSIHGGDIYNNKVNMDFSVNINPLGIPDTVKEAMSDALSYSPIPLANASPNPVNNAGLNSGKITLKNVLVGVAPNIYAASSYWLSIFSSTG